MRATALFFYIFHNHPKDRHQSADPHAGNKLAQGLMHIYGMKLYSAG